MQELPVGIRWSPVLGGRMPGAVVKRCSFSRGSREGAVAWQISRGSVPLGMFLSAVPQPRGAHSGLGRWLVTALETDA